MSLHHPAQNHLLAALPVAELELLRPELEIVPMPSGRVVHESGHPHEFVYFPTSCIVALLHTMANGASAKSAIVGSEGLVGIASFMGGETTTGQAVVQTSGYAYRLNAVALGREFRFGGKLRQLTLAYTQALIAQMTQTAVCHRHHPIEQQLCRWLLLSADRVGSHPLTITLGLMVRTLGTAREHILHALACLQTRGILRFHRGAIEILDREGLESMACECYAAVAYEYDRLLGTTFGARPRVSRRAPPEATGDLGLAAAS